MYIYLNIHFFYAFNIYLSMRKMHLKKKLKCKVNHNLSKKLLIAVIFISIITGNIKFYNNKIIPLLMNYAEGRIQEMSSTLTTQVLNEKLLTNLKTNDLFLITRDNNRIKTIDFNPVIINQIIIDSLINIREALNDSLNLKKEKISLGSIFDNPFLTNKGPKITVSYELANDLSANLNNKITPYGINNAIVETYINVELCFKVLIPMSSKKIKSKFNIPISIKIIEGSVPEYYMNGYNENSSILSLPNN